MYAFLEAPRPITIPGGMPGPLGATDDRDLILLYAAQKTDFYNKNGPYKNADGTLASGQSGRSVPRIRFSQAEILWLFWTKTWNDLYKTVEQAGRPTSSILNAYWSAQRRYTEWLSKYSQYRSSSYLPLAAADSFFYLLGRFVQEIDAGVWFGFNTETAWERAGGSVLWALKTAPERVTQFAKDIAESTSFTWKILKWGTAAFLVAWAAVELTKSAKGRSNGSQ